MMTLAPTEKVCPSCDGDLYLCEAEHFDGPSPRLHCRRYSTHNFTTDPGSPESVDVEQTASTNTETQHPVREAHA